MKTFADEILERAREGGMEQKEVYLFRHKNHVSGWPWMRAACCGERINRQQSVEELTEPIIYGMALPEAERDIVTHIAKMRCKCGKTVLLVEGNLGVYVSNGCFITEKSESRG